MLKLISTEIDETTIQLTYTDGSPADASEAMVVFRVPLQGELKRPVLWHHLQALLRLQSFAGDESRRVREELEKID